MLLHMMMLTMMHDFDDDDWQQDEPIGVNFARRTTSLSCQIFRLSVKKLLVTVGDQKVLNSVKLLVCLK